MSDGATEGVYRWVDGTALSWSIWKGPNPNGNTAANCVVINKNREWYDVSCVSPTRKSVCQSTMNTGTTAYMDIKQSIRIVYTKDLFLY